MLVQESQILTIDRKDECKVSLLKQDILSQVFWQAASPTIAVKFLRWAERHEQLDTFIGGLRGRGSWSAGRGDIGCRPFIEAEKSEVEREDGWLEDHVAWVVNVLHKYNDSVTTGGQLRNA